MEPSFNHAFILSGGGTRLMIYLGMYAALEKLDLKPEVLIGTCGGAFAATVINSFADHETRKEFIKSEAYFNFLIKKQLTQEKKLFRIGLFSLQKRIDKRNAPFIEDVFNKYIVEIPEDFAQYFPVLAKTKFSNKRPTLIMGSKLLFDRNSIGEKRNQQKLYKRVIFTDTETAKKLDVEKTAIYSDNYKNSAVDSNIKVKTNVGMLTSARISISDMFYVPPVSLEGSYYAGGAIDLVPIEVAKHIAKSVIIEKKQVYSSVEEALVRSVLGYSGNKRLLEVQKQAPHYQIDTRNIKEDLAGHYINKGIDWQKFEIYLGYPKSYKKYRLDMDKQWNYGFQQTMKSIKK